MVAGPGCGGHSSIARRRAHRRYSFQCQGVPPLTVHVVIGNHVLIGAAHEDFRARLDDLGVGCGRAGQQIFLYGHEMLKGLAVFGMRRIDHGPVVDPIIFQRPPPKAMGEGDTTMWLVNRAPWGKLRQAVR